MHALRIIQFEQAHSGPACGGTSSKSAIFAELEMIAPLLSARIKENRDLVGLRIDGSEIWPLFSVTIETRISEVLQLCSPAVLFGDDIVLLNHLFLRPVPAEFGRRKTERIQEFREAALHLGEGFVDRKMFAEILLGLEPNVFGRILLRSIGGK